MKQFLLLTCLLLIAGIFSLALVWILWPWLGIFGLLVLACGAVLAVVATWYGVQRMRVDLMARRHMARLVHSDYHAVIVDGVPVSLLPPVSSSLSGPSPLALCAPTMPVAPPFAALRAQITPTRLPLAYTQSGPLYGQIDQLLSTGVIGLPKRGKSSYLCYVAALVLSIGGVVLVFDPHGTLRRELPPDARASTRLRIASTEADRATLASEGLAELNTRLERWGDGEDITDVLLFLLDEYPAICEETEVSELARRGTLEGRKVSVFTYLAGHTMKASMFGSWGKVLPENLTTKVYFYTSDRQAAIFGLAKEHQGMLDTLASAGPGIALFWPDSEPGPTVVAFPLTTSADLATILSEREQQAGERSQPEKSVLSILPPLSRQQKVAESDRVLPWEVLSAQQLSDIRAWARADIPARAMPRLLGKSNNLTRAISAYLATLAKREVAADE